MGAHQAMGDQLGRLEVRQVHQPGDRHHGGKQCVSIQAAVQVLTLSQGEYFFNIIFRLKCVVNHFHFEYCYQLFFSPMTLCLRICIAKIKSSQILFLT